MENSGNHFAVTAEIPAVKCSEILVSFHTLIQIAVHSFFQFTFFHSIQEVNQQT